jgi:hypothetical protein
MFDRWLEECERLDLSPTTLRTYRSQIDQVIRPHIGKVILSRLTPKHLDDLYGQMKVEGKSPKTVARQRNPRRHHRALAEEHSVAEPGARHEDRGVADLAQVADRRPDDEAAMAEGGATPDRRRDRAGADDDRILEDGRTGADLDGGASERTTAPSASNDPSPRSAVPTMTAEAAI